MFFFGSTYGGDLLGWDPATVTDPEAHEYRIFGVPRVEPGVAKLADSFAEFVQRILDRTVADPVGLIQLDKKEERYTFDRFVVGQPGEERPPPSTEETPRKKPRKPVRGVAKWAKLLDDPGLIVVQLRKTASQCKFRQFACACCRYIFRIIRRRAEQEGCRGCGAICRRIGHGARTRIRL